MDLALTDNPLLNRPLGGDGLGTLGAASAARSLRAARTSEQSADGDAFTRALAAQTRAEGVPRHDPLNGLQFNSAAGPAGAASDGGPSREAIEKQARSTAADFVAVTFVQPLLAQLRGSTLNLEDGKGPASAFMPGRAEKTFRAFGDAETARRIVHASNWPLVEQITKSLLKHAGLDTAGAPVSPARGTGAESPAKESKS